MKVRYFVLAGCAIAVLPVTASRAMLASWASTLFESLPFILAGVAAARLFSRARGGAAIFGCGCGSAPAALSLPGAVAIAFTLGPIPAILRVALGAAALRLLHREHAHDHGDASAFGMIEALVPIALVNAVVVQFGVPLLTAHALHGALGTAAGAVLAFVLAPCGVGVAGTAAVLCSISPAAAAGFLSVAGVFDVRTLLGTRSAAASGRDGPACAMIAFACILVAARHGALLVHPIFTVPLAICAVAAAAAAIQARPAEASGRLRVAAGGMLVAAILPAPLPSAAAVVTTADVYAGERVRFAGVVGGAGATLTRYAMTCCRADAAPVTLRLRERLRAPDGVWAEAEGTIVEDADGMWLRAAVARVLAPPADPFLYR